MYKVIKPKDSNAVIPELNATVLSATFKSKEGIQKECKSVLKTLRGYPKENKWQIRYYEKFWLLLSEYN